MYSFVAVLSLCSMLTDPTCKAPVQFYGAHQHTNQFACLKEAAELFAEKYRDGGLSPTITFSIKCERKRVDPNRTDN